MRVTVEVFGVVRDLVGGPAVEVELPDLGTARQALSILASRYPALLGTVLEAGGAPNPYFLLSLDGRHFVHDLDNPLPEGCKLLLITAMAGGC